MALTNLQKGKFHFVDYNSTILFHIWRIRLKKLRITIDGQTIEVEEGTTVLEAIKKLNKVVPTFCYHPRLPIFGGCRMCLVYDKKWKNSIIACGTKVYDGMEIETENEEVIKDRKFILEMLFTRHPLDCPICDKAGECDLQNWGTYYGPQKNITPFTPFDKVRPEEDWQSEFFEFVSNRCVLCLRCVSVCENVVGAKTLFQEERGFEILISPDKKPMDTLSSCEHCGLCVDICPVGAIIFKPFKHNARAWLLKETISHCGLCSFNCRVAIDHDGKDIYRIRSTSDLEICLGAYLGYDIYKKDRLKGALKEGKNISVDKAIKEVAKLISEETEKTAIILSSFSVNEVYQKINDIQEKTGVLVSSVGSLTYTQVLNGFKDEYGEDYKDLSEKDILEAKRIVVIGDDVANVNPALSYMFNKLYYEGKVFGNEKEIIYIGYNLDKLKKYNPKYIELSRYDLINNNWEDSYNFFDEDTVVIYCATTFKGKNSYIMGKKLGKLRKRSKVLITSLGRNLIGQNRYIKNLTDLRKIISLILKGQIKNLIIFGEDILEHFEKDYLKSVFINLKKIINITPFNDGLVKDSYITIGSSLWMEEKGTVDSWRGTVCITPSIKNSITEEFIVSKIDEYIDRKDKVKIDLENVEVKDEGYIYSNIRLEDFSYFSKKSENIKRLLEEKMANVDD